MICAAKDLRNSSYRKACLFKPKFFSCDLRGVDFYKTSLQQSIFEGCSMRGANLRESDFSRSTWTYTNLEGADFRKSNFHASIFYSVDFSGADLRGVDFSCSEFHSVNFADADLRWVDFTDCYFQSVSRLLGEPWQVSGLRHLVNFRGAQMPDFGYGLGDVCVSSWSGEYHVLIAENQTEGWVRLLSGSGKVSIFPWYHKLSKFVSMAKWKRMTNK